MKVVIPTNDHEALKTAKSVVKHLHSVFHSDMTVVANGTWRVYPSMERVTAEGEEIGIKYKRVITNTGVEMLPMEGAKILIVLPDEFCFKQLMS